MVSYIFYIQVLERAQRLWIVGFRKPCYLVFSKLYCGVVIINPFVMTSSQDPTCRVRVSHTDLGFKCQVFLISVSFLEK